jgi:hypothetical protein
MLEQSGASIASALASDDSLPVRSGDEVSQELGGRFLVRYMLRRQLGTFAAGSTAKHYLTPTPLASSEVRSVLALPNPGAPRRFAMMIDPAEVDEIQGPRWVRGGSGIEYVLPRGFPSRAVLLGWEILVA